MNVKSHQKSVIGEKLYNIFSIILTCNAPKYELKSTYSKKKLRGVAFRDISFITEKGMYHQNSRFSSHANKISEYFVKYVEWFPAVVSIF